MGDGFGIGASRQPMEFLFAIVVAMNLLSRVVVFLLLPRNTQVLGGQSLHCCVLVAVLTKLDLMR